MPTKRLDPSQRRFQKGSAELESFDISKADLSEHNRKLRKQQRNKEIRKDFRRSLKKENNVQIKSFKKGERYDIAVIHIKGKDGSEWVAVRDYETMDELAKADVKEMAESEGAVNMFAPWVVEDALDKEKMYFEMSELIEDDVEEGVFDSRAEAREHYRRVIDDPEEREVYFPKNTWNKYVDLDELADSVIAIDGATHVLSRYDGQSHETEEFDYVYWREN
jgi:hypothetical protein